MLDLNTRKLRYQVVEQLVELASPADEQVEHFGVYIAELLHGWMNWSDEMLPVLEKRGALSPDIVRTTRDVSAALWALDRDFTIEYEQTRKIQALSEAGLRDDPRWETVRQLARRALAAFRDVGIPTPSLSDPDFNTRRPDAP